MSAVVSPSTFPSTSELPRTLSWHYAVVTGLGAAILIVVSFGPMAAEIGNLSLVVWPLTAAVGALQCLLLAELTSRFPNRAGGVAQFGYRAVPGGSLMLGAASSWAYWFAWTPGIAAHLILVVTYVRDVFWADVNTFALALAIGIVLYAINSAGLRYSMFLNVALAVCSFTPLLLILVGTLAQPSVFDVNRIWPLATPDDGGSLVLALLKWTFVAAWAAYGAEMVATVCSETRDAARRIPRALGLSSVVCLASFTLVPLTVFGSTNGDSGTAEGLLAFVPAVENLLGSSGPKIIGLMFICALLLSAQVFIIGSSRTIYQMARDGHIPRVFCRTNKRGAPIGSLAFDVVVIVIMLAIFGTNVVNVIASAAVGYLVVFLLLPLAYIVLRRSRGQDRDTFQLRRGGVALATVLFVFNLIVLVVGGSRWGIEVIGVGLAITLAIVPISLLTRLARRGRQPQAAERARPSHVTAGRT